MSKENITVFRDKEHFVKYVNENYINEALEIKYGELRCYVRNDDKGNLWYNEYKHTAFKGSFKVDHKDFFKQGMYVKHKD